MQKRLMATVVFSGELDPDPAAAALREAGYEVVTMPEKFRSRLVHPRDDFMEVTKRIVSDEIEQAIEAMMDDVGAIVDRYEAICNDCGQIDENHVPFSDALRGPEDLGVAGDEVKQGKQERSDE